MSSAFRFSSALAGVLAVVPLVLGAVNPPHSLSTENLVNPLGVNTLRPRLSWKNDLQDMTLQTAYEIVAGTDSAGVATNKRVDLWKSGKVKSDASVLVAYGGKPLDARTQVWWKVRVWNESGRCSDWSPVARFGVGIVDGCHSPIRGEYIAMSTEAGDVRAPILRKSFSVDNLTGCVMAHVNSLGYHELYVNGRKAGNNVLSPGVSQLGKRSLIVTYDITSLLSVGDNEIVVRLGQGWYKSTTFNAEYPGPVVKVEVDRVVGRRSSPLLCSDGSWQAAAGGRYDTGTWNALRFGGEKVDGRVEPVNMSATSLDALQWSDVARPQITPHVATPEVSGSNHIVRSGFAVGFKRLADGSYLVDMGRVLTGWFELSLHHVAAGTEITMEYSDNLTSSGDFDPQGESDIYIASGRRSERFCNKFNHHAYRYVKISGLPFVPNTDNFIAHQIHGEYADASSFKCSDDDLNAIHDMIKYTMKCLTFSGYMVDCPHLERTGYGGDGNSSTMTLQTMYDVAPTYANWLQAWGDVMDEDGSLPHVAPTGGGGGGPYWCGFIVLAPWRTWLNYGDSRVLTAYYPLMKKWMGYVERYSPDGLLQRWPDTHNRVWFLGDWLAPAGVDAGNGRSVDLVSNCFISDCLDKMEQTARVLGYDDDAQQWHSRREALNQKIHATFYDAALCQYATGSQLDMSYPMLVGATPQSLRQTVSDRMLQLSHTAYRDHIGAGLVGVPIVTQWAISQRQPDFMATMLRQRDYPGYLYMIDNGATATWEYWSGERSRVHNCYNGIGLWFYQGLGGIIPDSNAPGYRHFTVAPQPAIGVNSVDVVKETPYGTVKFSWQRDNSAMTYTLDVPVGTTATVSIPDRMELESEGYTTTNGAIELKPGHYTLRFTTR